MNFRSLFVFNWRWKAFSLLLAAGIWFFVDANLPNGRIIRKNLMNGHGELQATLPVALLATGQLAGGWRADPSEVDVIVRGSMAALQELDWRGFRAFVDVTGLATNSTGAVSFERVVQVHTPAPFEITQINPPTVTIRRVSQFQNDRLIAPSADSP